MRPVCSFPISSMFQAIYSGPEVNLGRFGVVKPGQQLRLTPAEVRGVREDKRFKIKSEVISTDAERRMELSETGHAELFFMASQARAKGRPIEFQARYSKGQLIHALLAMEKNEAQQRAKAQAEAAAARDPKATLRAMTGK